ncbi:MAG: ornithine carbamoyltransferase [Deltaproteobacteria bacterium]|jgi:ornithine carbamoyltransferase|nr:ornithine carbamoyltransferase [Deltaproteobacteria bacterium]
MKKDLLSIRDLTKEELLGLLEKGLQFKKQGRKVKRTLQGYTLGMLFDKASTRTRISFETAMFRLGGQTLFMHRAETQLSRDETVGDTARVLSRYLDAMAIRTFSQQFIEGMAREGAIPVINALTDRFHPCQVLSDLMTILEKRGNLDDLKVAWVGDGNNVAHSWINAAHVLGFELVLACPPGYHPLPEIVKGPNKKIEIVGDPKKAVKGADAVNTDVWASMGQEHQRKKRILAFQGFQVNQELLKAARRDVLVMHCLPAHRGDEITSDVMDGPNSVVFDQAENKMHLHMAVLEKLILRK